MPTFENNITKKTNFRTHNRIYITYHLENGWDFTRLGAHYKRDMFRFKVSVIDLYILRQIINIYSHTFRVVEERDQFRIIVETDVDHSNSLDSSVLRKKRNGYLIFLQKDVLSIEQTIGWGKHRSQTVT